MSRVALATTSIGLLAAGAMGQEAALTSLEIVRPDDPLTLLGGPISGVAGRGEACGANAVNFTTTVLRSENQDVPGNRHASFRAENFTTAAAGDLTLTTVTWWGVYLNVDGAGAIVGMDVLPGSESFQIRVMGDDAMGSPDTSAVISDEIGVTGSSITRTATGLMVGVAQLFRYEYTLAAPANLAASSCFWVEITQDDDMGVIGAAGHQWLWATDNDDARYHLTDDQFMYGNYSEFIRTFDPAVCLDLDLTVPGNCAFASGNDPCVQDVTLPDATCQGTVNSNTINFSEVGGFTLADDFLVDGAGTFSLTEICWRGAYARTNPTVFSIAPDTDTFSLAVYANDNGAPGTPLATLVQDVDFTLARGYDLTTGDFEYAVTLTNPIMVQGGTCFWISIVNDNVDTRWGWHPSLFGNLTHHRADATASVDWPDAFDLTTIAGGADFNFCMSVTLVPDGGCAPPVCDPPANDDCFSAAAVTVGGASVIGTNVCATRDPFVAEPCGFANLGFGDVYYTVTNTSATDMDLTATTDLPGTMIDSRISVYCTGGGTACIDELSCVASNDDGGANATSVVTWTAMANETYYLRVDGFDVGDFEIGVTGAAATGPVPPCENCELEDVADPVPAGTIVEAEGCGSNTNDAVGAAEAGPSVDGGIWRGTAYADADDRDFDFFSFSLAETTDLQLTWRSEFPALYNLLDASGGFLGGFFIAADCGDGVVTEHIELPAGDYFILYLHASGGVSTPNNFFGAPCGTHDEIEVTMQDLRGACCLSDGTCAESLSLDHCEFVLLGTYDGLGTDCGAAMCPGGGQCACETDGDANQVDVFDLLAYLDLWFVNAAGADIDGVAGVDVFDLLFFLDCWFPASAGAPCP